MKTKLIEKAAFEHLKVYLEERLPGSNLIGTMNKGSKEAHLDVADAILEYEGRRHHVEIKSSNGPGDHNIRFSHQTIGKAINKDVIVALITNVASGQPTFNFFRLADIAPHLGIEPKFYIAKKNTLAARKPLGNLLALPDGAVNVTQLLNSTVRSHISKGYLVGEVVRDVELEPAQPEHLPHDAPLWSPFTTEFDADGDPHPPWLMFPNMPMGSMGWRMGDGEDYNNDFGTWLDSLKPEKLAAYGAKYPVPNDWKPVWRQLRD